MATLKQILTDLPADTLLADGGTTANAEHWLDSYDADELSAEYATRYDSAGRLQIEKIGADGYRVSPPELVQC